MIEYEKQANDFLEKTKTTFNAKFLKNDFHFPNDKEKRDIYEITLKSDRHEYKFKFGQSIVKSEFIAKLKLPRYANNKHFFNRINDIDKTDKSLKMMATETFKGYKINEICIFKPKEPRAYDVLSCLHICDCIDFQDFCDSFGYDTDNISAEKTYKLVLEETNNLYRLFTTEELEQLQEIQ